MYYINIYTYVILYTCTSIVRLSHFIYRSIDDVTTDDASFTLLTTTIQKPKLQHGHGISED